MGCDYYTDYFYEVDGKRINITVRQKNYGKPPEQDINETDDDYDKRYQRYVDEVYNACKRVPLRINYEWVVPDNKYRHQASSYISEQHISLRDVKDIYYVEQSWERL